MISHVEVMQECVIRLNMHNFTCANRRVDNSCRNFNFLVPSDLKMLTSHAVGS